MKTKQKTKQTNKTKPEDRDFFLHNTPEDAREIQEQLGIMHKSSRDAIGSDFSYYNQYSNNDYS